MRLPLRLKILSGLLVLGGILLSVYVGIASHLFAEDKAATLRELTQESASSGALLLHDRLLRIADQLRSFAITRILVDPGEGRLPSNYLQAAHILAVRLYLKAPTGYVEQPIDSDVPTLDFDRARIDPWLREAAAFGTTVWSTQETAGRKFFVAAALDLEIDGAQRNYLVVAEIEPKVLLELMQTLTPYTAFLARPDGKSALEFQGGRTAGEPALGDHPLLAAARNAQGTRLKTMSFPFRDQKWVGAYAAVGVGDLFLLSQAQVTAVPNLMLRLQHISLLFSIVVATAILFFSLGFGLHLTKRLNALSAVMERLIEGDWTVECLVGGRDEIGRLGGKLRLWLEKTRVSRENEGKNQRGLAEKVTHLENELKASKTSVKESAEKSSEATEVANAAVKLKEAASEVSTPLSEVLTRLEEARAWFPDNKETLPKQVSDILESWETDFKREGAAGLAMALQFPSTIHPDVSLFEEDIDNLKKAAHYWHNQNVKIRHAMESAHDQAQKALTLLGTWKGESRSNAPAIVSLPPLPPFPPAIHCHEALINAVVSLAEMVGRTGVSLKPDFGADQDSALVERESFTKLLATLVRHAALRQIATNGANPKEKSVITIRTSNEANQICIDILDHAQPLTLDERRLLLENSGPTEPDSIDLALCRRQCLSYQGDLEWKDVPSGNCLRLRVPFAPQAPVQAKAA